MDTEEKKLTSSEIDELLKDVESTPHTPIVEPPKKNKKTKIRFDIIIAAIVAILVLGGVISIIVNVAKNSSKASKTTTTNKLMDEKYPEISDVVKNYLNAYLITDPAKRASILAQYVDNMGDIAEGDIKQNSYVKSYANIECYTKNGPYENTYVVYAYYEMELKNISTKAPTITTLYVIRDSKTGNVYIHNGVNSKIKAYISDVSKDQDVQDLFADVNKSFQKALSSDSRLKAFFDKLNNAQTTAAPTTKVAATTKAAVAATTAAPTTKVAATTKAAVAATTKAVTPTTKAVATPTTRAAVTATTKTAVKATTKAAVKATKAAGKK